MRSSGKTKYAPVIGVLVILICAGIHVAFTVKEHRMMLTALPLWMRVAFVLVFWGLVLLVGAVCYFFIVKHHSRILVLVAVLAVLGLLFASFLYIGPDSETASEDRAYWEAVEAQKEWDLNVSACKEVFFASSDHSAFGEGFRYAVLEGTVAFPNTSVNEKGDEVFQTSGSEDLSDAGSFLEDVYTALDVPDDYRLALPKCDWVLYGQDDGSKLLVAQLNEGNMTYVAEQLL